MRVVLMTPRTEALIVILQRGLAATLANPHPFAPASVHLCPKPELTEAKLATRP